MADLTTTLCGIKLKNPFILSSGPLSYSGQALIRAFRAGAGAVVTKTISLVAARNPRPHMIQSAGGVLLNAEKWSDLTAEAWIENEIPLAKAAGVTVIGSIGLGPRDAAELTRAVSQSGVDLIELVSYDQEALVPMVREARPRTDKPILAKVSANWSDLLSVVQGALAAGANGITAIDSIGPGLRLDVKTGRPLLGGPYGYGWVSGTAIKPLALRVVADIALRHQVDIVGVGGISKGEDALEMLMAGATAVGLTTAAILRGVDLFGKLTGELSSLLDRGGFASVAAAARFSLPWLKETEDQRPLHFSYDPDRCTDCQRCAEVCPYQARQVKKPQMLLDIDLCRQCGLCVSVCPTAALVAQQ